jgi:adiponectin receptor
MSSSVSQRKPYAHKNAFNQSNGHIQTARRTPSRKPILLSYDDLPTWYQDNEYIRRGYRPVSNSTTLCLGSWTYIHNETFNIYSHLIPALLFLLAQALVSGLISRHFSEATLGDRLIFAFFLLTAAITLALSCTYHTLMNHSMRISHLWLRLDYLGIMVLTLGDFVSGIYLVFYCEPKLQKVYWGMVGVLPETLGSFRPRV